VEATTSEESSVPVGTGLIVVDLTSGMAGATVGSLLNAGSGTELNHLCPSATWP
jgi:hypothetical protein